MVLSCTYTHYSFPSFFITGDEFDETMSDHMGKREKEINLTQSSRENSGGEETEETLLSKLHGTYGIILIGVLIFMAGLSLVGFLLFSLRQRGRRGQSSLPVLPSTSVPNQVPLPRLNTICTTKMILVDRDGDTNSTHTHTTLDGHSPEPSLTISTPQLDGIKIK